MYVSLLDVKKKKSSRNLMLAKTVYMQNFVFCVSLVLQLNQYNDVMQCNVTLCVNKNFNKLNSSLSSFVKISLNFPITVFVLNGIKCVNIYYNLQCRVQSLVL